MNNWHVKVYARDAEGKRVHLSYSFDYPRSITEAIAAAKAAARRQLFTAPVVWAVQRVPIDIRSTEVQP
jgi:hypothetical protein